MWNDISALYDFYWGQRNISIFSLVFSLVNANQRSLLIKNSSKPLIAIGGIDEKNIGVLLKDNYNFFAISKWVVVGDTIIAASISLSNRSKSL